MPIEKSQGGIKRQERWVYYLLLPPLMVGAKGYQNIKQVNEYAVKIVKVIDADEAWITRRMVEKLLIYIFYIRKGKCHGKLWGNKISY